MLTLKEARSIFFALKLCSFIHWLPFDFDTKTGRIKRKGPIGQSIFRVIFIAIVLYEFNFIYTLIKTQLSDTPPPFGHFSNHIIFIIAMGSDICSAGSYFFRADDIVLVFNELYFNSSTGIATDTQKATKKRKKTVQDKLPGFFLALPIIVPFGYIMQVLEDPTRAHVLGNAFNLAYDGILFKITVLIELLCINCVTSTLLFTQFSQLTAFEKMALTATKEMESLRSEPQNFDRLERSTQLCRRLWLMSRMQNVAFSGIAYICKMVGLTVSTLHLFFAMKLAGTTPPDSIANAVMGVVVIATRLWIYDKAYRVPIGLQDLKAEVLVQGRKIQDPQSGLLLRKELGGIREEAIKMGRFYNVERESTLIAVGFIISQVVSLLVAFE